MDCPKCQSALATENYKGIEIDRCPECRGMWLDYDELDKLENQVMDDDPAKGTMVFRSFQGDLHCPKCQGPLQMFRYRGYNLELDFCPARHGFWLDAGEEKRVLELMGQRTGDLKRKAGAEAEWARLLKGVKSRSFADRMKGLFR